MRHVTRMNASCRKYTCVTSPIWHKIDYEVDISTSSFSPTNESWHTYESIMSHAWMRRVAENSAWGRQINCLHTYAWSRHIWMVTSHIRGETDYSRLPKCQISHIFSNKALHIQGAFSAHTWMITPLTSHNRGGNHYSMPPKCQVSHISHLFQQSPTYTGCICQRELALGKPAIAVLSFSKTPYMHKRVGQCLVHVIHTQECMSYILKSVCHTYWRVYVIHTQECMSYILVGQCLVYVIHTHTRLALEYVWHTLLRHTLHEYVWHTRLAFEYVWHLSMYGVATASRID